MTPSRRYCLYALGIIFLANFLSYLDRQIVSALQKELMDPKQGFGLTPDEFGWTWTAFTIGYMVFAPIVGFLTGRYRRTLIFAVCIFLWSLATIWSGAATVKWELFAARFCIGIGEAGCLVIGPTLLSDYFSKEFRGRALAIFFLGVPLGGTAGYIVGGVITEHLGGWRNAFYFAGLPGILVALLVGLLAEPPRGGVGAAPEARVKGVKPYLDLLKNRTLLLIILAQAFAVIILVPLLHYGVGFFQEMHKMSKTEATITMGVMALVAGGLGNTLSGIIGDKLSRRMKGAYALLAGIAFTAGMPCLLIGFLSDEKWLFLPALGLGSFFYFLCMPAVNTQIANSVPAAKRAMAFALAVFILHLLGDSGAAPLFGKVAQWMSHKAADPHHLDPVATRSAFVIFSFAMLFAGLFALLAVRTAKKDEEAAGPPAATGLPVH